MEILYPDDEEARLTDQESNAIRQQIEAEEIEPGSFMLRQTERALDEFRCATDEEYAEDKEQQFLARNQEMHATLGIESPLDGLNRNWKQALEAERRRFQRRSQRTGCSPRAFRTKPQERLILDRSISMPYDVGYGKTTTKTLILSDWSRFGHTLAAQHAAVSWRL